MYREREKESCLIFAYMNHYTPNFNLIGSGKYTKSNTLYIPVLSHCLVLSAIEAFESNNHWQLPDVFLCSLLFVCQHLFPSSDQLNLSGMWVQKQVCKLHQIHPLMEFMYLVYTCMPGEIYSRWLRSLLLGLWRFFSANWLLCVLFLHECSGPCSVSDGN